MSPPSSDRSGDRRNAAVAKTFTSARASKAMKTTALDDLPIVIELRKLHREAGLKGKRAPRSSDEGKKWLEWSEYLEVIRLLKSDLNEMMEKYDTLTSGIEEDGDGNYYSTTTDTDGGKEGAMEKRRKPLSRTLVKSIQSQRKAIATTFQQYLILSFFACVPDRQRTYRELELDRSFIRLDADGREDDDGAAAMPVWVIKHNAEDYKTGATYGERPPLPLSSSLTPDIDDFLARWRPALLRGPPPEEDGDPPPSPSSSSFLFLQPRTGNPLTANSVYQIVSRCCYKYKQKKTNPHLLRDMIVTHVRKNADASEKELEALALFMGHSIQMQRDSYDRRTLEQKVSPAVRLMRNMNSLDVDGANNNMKTS